MKEKDYCRCCLSEDCDKDMLNEYFFEGTSEVYLRMLAETFDINISQRTNNKYLICDLCISRLREAAAFKKQVLATEQSILKLATLIGGDDPKIELKTEDDDFDDRVSDFSDSDFAWGSERKDTDGQIFVIKIESNIQNSTQTSGHMHSMTPDDISSNTTNLSSSKTSDKTKSNEKVLVKSRAKSIKVKKDTTNVKAKSNKGSKSKLTELSEYDIDRRKNTLKLLLNSNMCMFISHRVKYGCYACKETFIDMPTLREHTNIHTSIKYLTSKITLMRGLSFKNVDISDLKCKKCDTNCNDLVDLQNHLTTSHKIDFLNNDHYLIPYRLKDELRCVLCEELFNTFTRLSIHMNTHYTNNVCDACGLSFINRLSLRAHKLAQHKERKCELCGAVFMKWSSKKSHMRQAHKISRNTTRHCNMCEKTFKYTYMLEEHKINEHNYVKPPILQCSECDKSFLNKVNLRTHIRAVHLKEREHPCDVCDMRFFTKFDRIRHERTHEDVKSFSCSYCDVKFKCKDSRRRHLKKQHAHLSQP